MEELAELAMVRQFCERHCHAGWKPVIMIILLKQSTRCDGNTIGAGWKLSITIPATKDPTRYVGLSDLLVQTFKFVLVGITIKMIAKHPEFCMFCGL